ncbi:MAG: hypothetical protein AAGI89_10855 [Pseudomonadota bacterium]
MKLTSRYGAAMIGIFLALIIFFMIVRGVDAFDPMAAAIVWTIGGLAFAVLMILSSLRKKDNGESDGPEDAGEMDLD